MVEIRYTLLSEGTSDRALLPIISWLLLPAFQQFEAQVQEFSFNVIARSRRA